MARRSRAGRTGRSWYGSYDLRYADPTAEGGARYVGGVTNKAHAIRSARQMVERDNAAWAEVLTDRLREGGGQVIVRFEQTPMRKTSRQLDREIAQALLRREPVSHSTQLANWWRKATPEEDHVCYDTKTKALKAFLDTNYEIVQNYGGVDYAASPSEFDAINHKYNLQGKRAARTIAQAVWAAMPEGKPYCLDRIDLDALNGTSPARESHLAFRLPDYVYEAGLAAEEEKYYRSLGAHARICRRCGLRLK